MTHSTGFANFWFIETRPEATYPFRARNALCMFGGRSKIREHFDEPLKIDEFARQLGMSVSGFHHHFKSVTAMSPLQFQKQIRLQEARRLMLSQDMDAASAGFCVGYDDPSYFSRDYKKLFGSPPQRDIVSLRSRLDA
ncbi:MAG TPA: AraC family transcriptional regulator [Pyrinomonadaceae bacterium]|nr:AraC family transcriptional regulator [Pyrinomonadaceae bacterium]